MNQITSTSCETASGIYVDVVDPDPTTINLFDIVWSLSRQARFAGHTLSEEIWSVAQHAIFVESLVHGMLNGNAELQTSCIKWNRLIFDWTSLNFTDEQMRAVQLGALHHDDSEAYLVDLPSPVKRHSALRWPYKQLEDKVTEAIGTALKLPALNAHERAVIHWADLLALRIEAAHLMRSGGADWGELPDIDGCVHLFPKITNWRDTMTTFLMRHDQLTRAK